MLGRKGEGNGFGCVFFGEVHDGLLVLWAEDMEVEGRLGADMVFKRWITGLWLVWFRYGILRGWMNLSSCGCCSFSPNHQFPNRFSA